MIHWTTILLVISILGFLYVTYSAVYYLGVKDGAKFIVRKINAELDKRGTSLTEQVKLLDEETKKRSNSESTN